MAAARTLLAVHGHPDDETVHIGGTLARYAAQGVRVVCVTATRGELGRIVDPGLDSAENRRRLGELRLAEMGRALAVLGPIEWRWLGYRDSGLADSPTSLDAEAFWSIDPEAAAGRVAAIIRELRPQVVITHNETGDDGHPDHVAAARATRIAFARAGDPAAWPDQLGAGGLEPWAPLKLYENVAQLGRRDKVWRLVREVGAIRAIPTIGRALLRLRPAGERLRHDVAAGQGETTTRIDVRPFLARRRAAILEFRTQVDPHSALLALSPEEQGHLTPTEDYTLRSTRVDPTVPEDDLFAGVPDQVRQAGPARAPAGRPPARSDGATGAPSPASGPGR